MMLLNQLLFDQAQLATAGFFVLFMALSFVIAWCLGRADIEGMVWGFLILAASSDLALFLSRVFSIKTSLFGALVVMVAGPIIYFLRVNFFKSPQEKHATSMVYIVVLIFFTVMIWTGNILRPLPDAGFSSHHGWLPLYVQESFLSGRFLEIKDMAFGPGVATSLFYPADLLGLVSFSGWLGANAVYPAFNAGSIVATVLLFWILSKRIHASPLSLVIFFCLTVLFFATDRLFQVTLGGNWGDVMMYLAGGLVAYYLTDKKPMHRGLLMAALASTFLVFARHYGAFYSALIIGGGFIFQRILYKDFIWRPWIWVGLTWLVFSFRELYYLFGRFTVYYPGSWQAERLGKTSYELMTGALTDWGLISASDLSLSSLSLRGLYLLVLAIVFYVLWRRCQFNKCRLFEMLAPLLLFALPLLLQIITGFRTNALYSKLYIIGVFIPAWYPAFLLSRTYGEEKENIFWHHYKKVFLAGGLTIAIMGGSLVTGSAYDRIQARLVKNDIVDRDMAETLRKKLPLKDFEKVVNTPVMYFLYEPGASLRLYLGGRFFNDLDFWSERVLERSKKSQTFGELLKALDYPNLYISMMGSGKISPFIDDERRRFFKEIEAPKNAIWLKQIISSGDARFYITKKSK